MDRGSGVHIRRDPVAGRAEMADVINIVFASKVRNIRAAGIATMKK